MQGLAGYNLSAAAQPDLVSVAGLWYRWAPAPVNFLLGLLCLAIAAVTTWCVWRRHAGRGRVPLHQVGWLWVLWFLATPYAHFDDELLLAFPLVAALVTSPASGLWLVVLMLLSALPWLLSGGPVGLLWMPLVLCGLLLWTMARASAPASQ
jgi:hypothetical protein